MKKLLIFLVFGAAGVALLYANNNIPMMDNVVNLDFDAEVELAKEKLIERFTEEVEIAVVPAAEAVVEPVKRELKILAFGDVMLGRHVRTLMDRYGKNYIFDHIYNDGWFWESDLVHANLEGPIKGNGKKGGTSMNFSFNEDVAPLLSEYGFNLVSIANNHSLDQGDTGRRTTIEALDGAGVGWCGDPTEEDPDSVNYGEVDGATYAFVCFHDVNTKINFEDAVDLIWNVRAKADFVIVSVHWGYEYKHSPDKNRQVKLAHAFVDAGADFIIGHHPHVVQSFEEYNGRLIFYSLGNFIFDQYWSKMTQEELSIGISLENGDNGFVNRVELFPMKSERSQPRLMNYDEKQSWLKDFLGYGVYDSTTQEQVKNGFIEISSER